MQITAFAEIHDIRRGPDGSVEIIGPDKTGELIIVRLKADQVPILASGLFGALGGTRWRQATGLGVDARSKRNGRAGPRRPPALPDG